MFRRFHIPKFLFSEHRPWYTDSVLRRFFSPKVRNCILYAVTRVRMITSQSQLKDANGCVGPKVTWDKTPTLWIEVHIFVNKGWKSVKLIYKENAVILLICWDFINEICDIIDIKQNRRLVSLVGKRPTHWVEMPTLWYLNPPCRWKVDVIFLITRILFIFQLDSYK